MAAKLESSRASAARPAGTAAQPPAAVVAQRLTDLLMAFPAAVVMGVPWRVLVKKYEERHATRLDLAALGLSSPLAAATTLLWDVLRLISSADAENPILGIEDEVALTPRPGLLACWPSLYRALCQIAGESGPKGLLLAQLKPLLERHWHANFDESGLGFLSAEGTHSKLRKMKHLVHDVIRWRDQRVAWQQEQGAGLTAVDEVLLPKLELVVWKSHTDLVLRLADAAAELPQSEQKQEPERPPARGASVPLLSKSQSAGTGKADPSEGSTEQILPPPEPANIFDDPFEPPPQDPLWTSRAFSARMSSSTADTADFTWEASSECGTTSTSLTASFDLHSSLPSGVTSGSMTPMQAQDAPLNGFAMVPMWFSLNLLHSASWVSDAVSVIPRGIVQNARAQFEQH